ncbi:MAG TPA: EpsD family peptidyl-prolyl cis-trans isomerase [Hydrogenophaga sp.]|uniref:EpsD family peptidyl-prolyl cis-trans isomerase n=1 Tax=Hydrogenophaga sp. TaxID=1904254 RepID=UPI002B56DDDD|nr:EpsD family peptidyl-prolyl cis-trans isomerase [Hydrogenophaga sp.]HSX94375.1 EpsD family peptidyl-prolyl cis-trans isomerase [Hydrogenophaga sp.]
MNTVRHTPAPSRPLLSALCAASLLLLSACGKADEGAVPAQASQVAAKVGSSEISVHQINQVLSRTPLNANSKEAVQSASRQALERLIDQQLAVDQATEQKLHRSPDVVAQLEAARREVLARAYLQQVMTAIAQPSPDEIRTYYKEHPALFSERRVFNLQEIRVVKAGPVMDQLQAMANEGRRIEEVADMLRGKGLVFGGGSATRTAEQLPLDLLPRIHALKDGQSLVVPARDDATFIRVASSRQIPLNEQDASAGIAKYLGNLRAAEAVSNEIKRLRAATTVTYVGEFEQAAATPGETASTAPASVTEEPKKDEPSVLERGIQGLK